MRSPQLAKLGSAIMAGVTILTRISVEDEVRAGDLCTVSFAGEGLWVHVDIVVPREGYRSFAVRAFLQYLAEHGAEALPAEAPPERIGEQELVSE